MEDLRYLEDLRYFYRILYWVTLSFLVFAAIVHAFSTIDFIFSSEEYRRTVLIFQPYPDEAFEIRSNYYVRDGLQTTAYFLALACCLIISRISKRNLREYGALFFVLCVFLLFWLLRRTNSVLES